MISYSFFVMFILRYAVVFDCADMVNSVKPDERSVMTYVSAYYHAFAGAQQVTGFIFYESHYFSNFH